jgi:hypothetical protein
MAWQGDDNLGYSRRIRDRCHLKVEKTAMIPSQSNSLQPDEKGGPLSLLAFEPDRSVVLFHQSFHDRQSEPDRFLACRAGSP